MTCNTDLETWLLDLGDRVYRLLEYRKPGQYTPYEMEHKFVDQSLFVSTHYKIGFIKEVIELPDKDVLIGFREAERVSDEEYETYNNIEYFRLSEIKLECFDGDQLGGES